MFRNYFRTAFRIHVKNKLYSFINFIGLSIALMLCFLVYLFVQDEFSYDNFHKNGDNLFLFHSVSYKVDNPKLEAGFWDTEPLAGIQRESTTNLPFLKLIESSIPEIESITRIEYQSLTTIRDGEESGEMVHYVDRNFFDNFSYPFLKGDSEVALETISDVVITKEFAIKHFGSIEVLGQDLIVLGDPNKIYKVKGVIELPHNTMLDLNIIAPVENSYYYKNHQDDWNYYAISAFFKLKDNAHVDDINSKIRNIFLDQKDERYLSLSRQNLKLAEDNPIIEFDLKNVSEVYLDPTLSYNKSSSPLYSYILIAISLVILIIASINYLSISIASSAGRRVEIAIRKVVGANIPQLKIQFYLEALTLTLLAVIGGFTLMQTFLPTFNEMAGKSLLPTIEENILLLTYGLFFGLFISFVAGGYPAQILARFKVLSGLKGQSTSRVSPGLIKGMMIFQFTLCLVFISFSIVMQKQFKYINDKDLGFDKEQMAIVGGLWGQAELVKQELSKYASVKEAGTSSGIFTGGGSFGTMVVDGIEHRIRRVRVGEEFMRTLDITFIDKEGFPAPERHELEEGKDYVNETYFNLIVSDSARFRLYKDRIAGVVKDFHFESLQTAIYPISFRLAKPEVLSTLFVKLEAGMTSEGVESIKEAYENITGEPLKEVRFMDAYLASRYKDSQRWQRIIDASTTLGILIASIGLFGMTGINLANRMKEISIRKVLGADFNQIALLLNRQTLLLILVAALISVPISYQLTTQWLEAFAYHVNVSIEIFIFSVLVLFGISLLTVLFHSIKSVKTNPAEILRSE
ncbi:ABC transporter permease [Roseivirga sp. E12]|uniref:ABC transporter permease n=1 Tax=Roseivirga sp. E12 TaxID=2819237 RepID=UPI001ABC426C|nr:ABC transporter permease [Roseivirga sp. E12]MBO3697147.1 ABC transporter permease [Roseivirga sp. E12]